jgi:hypothetical protein
LICWVASYPRSGNSLLRSSLVRYCGVRSTSIYVESGQMGLGAISSDPRPLELLRALRSTVPVKTHKLDLASDPEPAIYIVRDGRDAAVSYAHFLRRKEANTAEEALRGTMAQVIEGQLGFGSWSEHVRTWTSRQAPTYLVRYEDLVEAPARVARETAAELGLFVPPLNGSPRPPSFEEERLRRPMLIRRGVVGSWKTEMPAGLEARFWELHGVQMTALGYSR